MHYEKELRFLCNTLKKCRIKTSFLTLGDPFIKVVDESLNIIFENKIKNVSMADFLGKVEPYTIYKLSDSLRLCYIFTLLPATDPQQVLVIGPYLSESVSNETVLEIGEKNGVSPQKQRMLLEYYSGLATVPESSPIYLMLDTLGEQIFGGNSGFSIVDVNRELIVDAPAFLGNTGSEDVESLLANMELMQKRYDFENELMHAVTLGQEYKVARIMDSLDSAAFERRLQDPIRNLKNYCIIMNTLLRKAAENGGVHPHYINKVSSAYAARIEQTSSVKAIGELMEDMFRGYCRLVRNHSMKSYSPIVKKVITLINFDLSANLTLKTLAESQNISAGYLSAVFKKDTGITLTEYITKERMKLAVRLLSGTRLQIQTVALHCGIMDVQYFSKLFKKHTGKSPKEYRASVI